MKYVKGCLGVLVLLIIDQLTKFLAVAYLKPVVELPLLQGVFSLYYYENRGAVWGLMQGSVGILSICTFLILIFIIWIYSRIPDEKRFRFLKYIAVFIIAGALGNLIDRIFRHFVVDFIYFRLIDFPIFNMADVSVTVSAFALILLVLFYYKDEHDFDFLSLRRKKGEKAGEQDA